MDKKRIVLLLAALLLLACCFLPGQPRRNPGPVIHQHEVWPSASEEMESLDLYGKLTTHLPLIILKTQGQEIPGAQGRTEEDLYCEYAIIDNPDGVNHSDDPPSQSGWMAISIRGNSSRNFPKKQYAVKLVNPAGETAKQSLLGMPAESTWVLNGSYIDHSQIRNYMMYNISAEIMEYAPRCRLAEVMLTDAQGNVSYQGVYTLIEKPKISEARLNYTPYNPSYAETSFVVQMNAYIQSLEIPHLKADEIPVVYRSELKYPDMEVLTDASADYVRNQMLTFEKMLYDADHTGDWSRLTEIIDMDSFVDYYIINEFFQNYDAGRRSTYLHKGLGGRITMGPVWDFDSAFDNFVHASMGIDWLDTKTTLYYFYLTRCPDFIEAVSRRYEELRGTFLAEEYLLSYIDSTAAYLETAAQRNCDKWYGGDRQLFYDDIRAMKDFVVRRGAWMDENFIRQSSLLQ